MNFSTFLALSLVICLIGLAFRFYAWFSQGLQPPSAPSTFGSRLAAGLGGVMGTLLSARIITILRAVVTDLLAQQRVFRKSWLRWSAHTLIFTGFILLLLMHGMEAIVSTALFSGYESTLNPYLFLRNLFGLMVLAGIGLAVYRRITLKNNRVFTSPGDWAALALVGGIVLSGMLLEGTRISSYTVFEGMVEEYGAFDEDELVALEAFWVAENGLVSPNVSGPITAEQVELGREANSMSCIECHAGNRSAFVSFTLKGLTRPVAWILGDSGAVGLFTILHGGLCLALLAWLPFSKMFHVISAPVNLLVNAVLGKQDTAPANLLNRQMLGLSACTHCGSCSFECSSSMYFASFGNDFILPSEKVQFLKHFAAKPASIDADTRKRLQEGLYVCTSCDRCTDICPSGINLREIFVTARYALLADGRPEKTLLSHFSFPLALAKRYTGDHLQALKAVEELFRQVLLKLSSLTEPLALSREKGLVNQSYTSCFTCQRCTNICPVVRSYDNPTEALDLLPHQLIYTLGIGNTELAMGAKMIWSCSTCYLCQEHCPNSVELTDIFYTLKNKALQKIDSGENS